MLQRDTDRKITNDNKLLLSCISGNPFHYRIAQFLLLKQSRGCVLTIHRSLLIYVWQRSHKTGNITLVRNSQKFPQKQKSETNIKMFGRVFL